MEVWVMRPPSFEEFMKLQKAGAENPEDMEPFPLEECPTPGCKADELIPEYAEGRLTGFRCNHGCKFSVKRNVFTGDIVCFSLESFDEKLLDDPDGVKGMKFTTLGECFTEWY